MSKKEIGRTLLDNGIVGIRMHTIEQLDLIHLYLKKEMDKDQIEDLAETFGADKWLLSPANDRTLFSDEEEFTAGSMLLTFRIPREDLKDP